MEQAAGGRFVVLDDQPVEANGEHLLNVMGTARALVDRITDSHSSTPFTVAIDAGLGRNQRRAELPATQCTGLRDAQAR